MQGFLVGLFGVEGAEKRELLSHQSPILGSFPSGRGCDLCLLPKISGYFILKNVPNCYLSILYSNTLWRKMASAF